MIRFFVRRLVQGLLVVILAGAFVFFLMRLIPGDPAKVMAPRASEQALAALRARLGLDKPLLVQFLLFLSRAAHGDFGRSYYADAPAISLIFRRLPLTLLLTGLAMTIAVGLGVPMGVIAATRPNSIIDKLTLGVQMLFQSSPNFWVALVLMLVIAVEAKWLPATGYEGFRYAILPAVSLALGLVAIIARITRAMMLDVLQQDMVTALRARGIAPSAIVWKHAFKNSLIPILTLISAQVGYLLGGAVIIEYVFNYPGVGLLTLNAVLRRDYPLIQAIVVMASLILTMVNVLVDSSYGFIDPRVRQRGGG